VKGEKLARSQASDMWPLTFHLSLFTLFLLAPAYWRRLSRSSTQSAAQHAPPLYSTSLLQPASDLAND
jgi:hypothetical protein